jgi:2-polyprenyl-6-methoxyphenol hydroxylase-like FAD-dependent oxidoreductase
VKGRTNGVVLISGASVAGPVIAYWLHHHGFTPVVVERTPQHRHGSGGHAVDLFGPAVQVVERMGLAPPSATRGHATTWASSSEPGAPPLQIDVGTLAAGISDDGHVEIMRGDLARILHETTSDDVEYLFGDSVVALDEADDGVQVTFEHGAPPRVDLVVGADGLHSGVHTLVFGQ